MVWSVPKSVWRERANESEQVACVQRCLCIFSRSCGDRMFRKNDESPQHLSPHEPVPAPYDDRPYHENSPLVSLDDLLGSLSYALRLRILDFFRWDFPDSTTKLTFTVGAQGRVTRFGWLRPFSDRQGLPYEDLNDEGLRWFGSFAEYARFLYGYFALDVFRKPRLIRRSLFLHVRVETEEYVLRVSDFVPRDQGVFKLVIEDDFLREIVSDEDDGSVFPAVEVDYSDLPRELRHLKTHSTFNLQSLRTLPSFPDALKTFVLRTGMLRRFTAAVLNEKISYVRKLKLQSPDCMSMMQAGGTPEKYRQRIRGLPSSGRTGDALMCSIELSCLQELRVELKQPDCYVPCYNHRKFRALTSLSVVDPHPALFYSIRRNLSGLKRLRVQGGERKAVCRWTFADSLVQLLWGNSCLEELEFPYTITGSMTVGMTPFKNETLLRLRIVSYSAEIDEAFFFVLLGSLSELRSLAIESGDTGGVGGPSQQTVISVEQLKFICNSVVGLEELDFLKCHFPLKPAFARDLNHGLRKLKFLRLNLSHRSRGVTLFLRELSKGSRVEHLELSIRQQFQPRHVEALCEGQLRSLKSLQVVDSHGQLPPSYADYLAYKIPSLRIIDFRYWERGEKYLRSRLRYWERERILFSPPRSFNADIPFVTLLKDPSSRDPWQKKCISTWKLREPFDDDVNWKEYFEERAKTTSEGLLKIPTKEDDPRLHHLRPHASGLLKVEPTFDGLSDGEKEQLFRNCWHVLELETTGNGFRMTTKVYSLIGTGASVCFEYCYQYRHRARKMESSATLSACHTPHQDRDGPDGPPEYDVKQLLAWRSCSEVVSRRHTYGVADLRVLRQVEKRIFGAPRLSDKDLVRLIYWLSPCPSAQYAYSPIARISDGMSWIFRKYACLYRLRFSSEELEAEDALAKEWTESIATKLPRQHRSRYKKLDARPADWDPAKGWMDEVSGAFSQDEAEDGVPEKRCD